MAVNTRVGATTRNRMLDTINTELGSTAELRIYDGTIPTDPDTAALAVAGLSCSAVATVSYDTAASLSLAGLGVSAGGEMFENPAESDLLLLLASIL